MKIVGMAVEDDMSRVPAFVAVISAVQRLVKVSHEVDYELQRLHFRGTVRFWIFQDGT